MSFFEFPHTRTYDTDLGWIIKHLGELITETDTLQAWAAEHKEEYEELAEKVDGLINNLVDVISPWDSSIAYHIFSIVEYQGTNYIAVKDVPVGAMITNTEYWQPANTVVEQINAIGTVTNNALDTADDALTAANEAINIAENNINKPVLSPNITDIGAIDQDTYFPDQAPNGSFTIGNILYQYIFIAGTSGKLIPINMVTGAVQESIAVNAYHGNDFVAIGDTVYAAPYDDGAGSGVNKILVFNINTPASVLQIDAFEDTGYDCLYAIDKIDDDTLICALRRYGTNTVNSTVLYKYTISTGEISEITVDWSGANYAVNEFPHPIIFKDDYLFLSASFENGIYILKIDGNTAKVISYNALPAVSRYNVPFYELESLAMVPAHPDYIIIGITGRSLPNGQNWLLFEAVRIGGNGAKNLIKEYIGDGQFRYIHVKETYTGMFETGSETYPFKNASRAAFACKGTASEVEGTMILDSDITRELTASGITFGIGANSHNIAGAFLTRCNVYITGTPVFTSMFRIYSNTSVHTNNAGCTYQSGVRIENSSLKEGTSAHSGVITVENGTYDLSSRDPSEALTLNATYNSLVKVNRSNTTGISIGGGTTLLTPGVK